MGANNGNFLNWEGSFNDFPYSVLAVDDGPIYYTAGVNFPIAVLDNDVITYPISELKILSQSWIGPSAKWTGANILLYPPAAGFVGKDHTLTYQFKDALGRVSNIATVYINFEARATHFEAYEPTAYCEVTGSGQNTGQKIYTDGQKYYTDTNLPVLPVFIEPNTAGGSFIANITDTAKCPIPSQLFVPITVTSHGTYLSIDQVTLKKTGHADIVIALSVPVYSSGPTLTQTVPVPKQSYDDMIFRYSQNIANISAKTYSFVAGGSTGTSNWPTGSLVNPHNLSFGAIVMPLTGFTLNVLA